MESMLAVVVGILFACGVYLLLRRDLVRVVVGVALITNAVNLLFFAAGRLTRFNPPLVAEGEVAPELPFANPLPQALILTAIVIGFGLLAFTLVLVYRAQRELNTLDPDEMRVAEPKDAQHAAQGQAEAEEAA